MNKQFDFRAGKFLCSVVAQRTRDGYLDLRTQWLPRPPTGEAAKRLEPLRSALIRAAADDIMAEVGPMVIEADHQPLPRSGYCVLRPYRPVSEVCEN